MAFPNTFGDKKRLAHRYDVFSEEEDKMLPSDQTTRQAFLDLKASNRNLRRLSGLSILALIFVAALATIQSHNHNALMLPQIIRTPVPPSTVPATYSLQPAPLSDLINP